jgi:hypothetical protein
MRKISMFNVKASVGRPQSLKRKWQMKMVGRGLCRICGRKTKTYHENGKTKRYTVCELHRERKHEE